MAPVRQEDVAVTGVDVEMGVKDTMSIGVSSNNNKKKSAEYLDWEAANEALLKKISNEDKEELEKQHYQKYDYVMIFPMCGEGQSEFDENDPEHMEQSNVAKQVVNSLLAANFTLYTFLSVQKDELIVLLTLETHYLRRFAEKNEYQLPLDPVMTRRILSKGSKKYKFKAVKIADEPASPNCGLMITYLANFGEDVDVEDGIYQRNDEIGCVFSPLDRLKLMYTALLAPKHKFGCKLQVSLLKEKEHLKAIFPLHSSKNYASIMASVERVSAMPWDLPFEDIKNYFGESSALFYVFLSHQSIWLVPPALLGCILQIVVFSTGPNYSHPSLCFFAVMVMIWGVLMLRYYSRKESRTAMIWGMSNYESHEVVRLSSGAKSSHRRSLDSLSCIGLARRGGRKYCTVTLLLFQVSPLY